MLEICALKAPVPNLPSARCQLDITTSRPRLPIVFWPSGDKADGRKCNANVVVRDYAGTLRKWPCSHHRKDLRTMYS